MSPRATAHQFPCVGTAGDGGRAYLDDRMDGALCPADRRGNEVRCLEHAGSGRVECEARDLEMVKVLLAANADMNQQGGINKDTALIYGIRQQSPRNPAPMELARLLVEAGADVNLANRNGVTALLLAVQVNSPEGLAMVEALLARGADVDHRRCYSVLDSPARNQIPYLRAVGATALGVASSVGNTAAVRALIAADADVNLPQCDGKAPLALAEENGHVEVSEILRSAIASQ
jgi:uncharacterized protein